MQKADKMSSTAMLKKFALTTATWAALSMPVAAQNLFATVVTIDDAAITEYEVGQRALFMQTLGAPGATRDAAIDALIEDRLKAKASKEAGLSVDAAGIDSAMTEFAARANLSKDEFVTALGNAGVSSETFRDFVVNGVMWRDLIRGRFGSRVEIAEADIDRAMGTSAGGTSISVLLSEIIIPAPEDNPKQVELAKAQAEQASQATSVAQFSGYAREFSATTTREKGGRLDWVTMAKLPEQLRGLVLALAPGEVTAPLPIPGAVAVFQLRDIKESGTVAAKYSAIEYAAYYMAGGRSPETLAAAAALKDKVDVCDDLYGVAKGQPEEVLDRGTLPISEIPSDIAIELAKLDPNEVSTNLTRSNGQTLVLLMMCGRTAEIKEEVGREDIAQKLRQQRLNGFADSLLGELRAGSRIVRK